MRIYHTLLSLLLTVAAVLQWNDPDPFFWMSMYLIPAALSAGEAYRWLNERIFLRFRSVIWPVICLATLFYGLSQFPGLKPQWYNDEVIRESGGLFLIALHALISYWSVRNSANKNQD
ncbi:MAG: transmembrane 220 family protein [Leptospiraceae bacterium]